METSVVMRMSPKRYALENVSALVEYTLLIFRYLTFVGARPMAMVRMPSLPQQYWASLQPWDLPALCVPHAMCGYTKNMSSLQWSPLCRCNHSHSHSPQYRGIHNQCMWQLGIQSLIVESVMLRWISSCKAHYGYVLEVAELCLLHQKCSFGV